MGISGRGLVQAEAGRAMFAADHSDVLIMRGYKDSIVRGVDVVNSLISRMRVSSEGGM